MNRMQRAGLVLAATAGLVAGCATMGGEATPVAPESVAVYDNLGPKQRPFTVVKRLWTESWASAFWIPAQSSAEAAKTELQQQAAALGGEAIVNHGCYTRSRSTDAATGQSTETLICHGTVVRYTQ